MSSDPDDQDLKELARLRAEMHVWVLDQLSDKGADPRLMFAALLDTVQTHGSMLLGAGSCPSMEALQEVIQKFLSIEAINKKVELFGKVDAAVKSKLTDDQASEGSENNG